MKRFQGTVAKPVQFVGVGLHSGSLVNLEILPQGPDTRIVFERTDKPLSDKILACPDNITSTLLSTTIGHHPCSIATIEHLMAALWGMGIDNALVRVSAGEIPILDGSSAPFVDKFSEAGIQIQHVQRRCIVLPEPFEIREGDKFISYHPPKEGDMSGLDVRCSVDFPSLAIGKQTLDLRLSSEEAFLSISEARTFCHLDSIKRMREQGLALGGSLDNAVVVDDERVLNTEGLRFPDEFVRHKLLDFFGDMALLPGDLVGKVVMCKNGHSLHAKFSKEIMNYLRKVESPSSSKPAKKRFFSAIG
jgi:UDP-3-O-[3-hydroxymyristoyl] N-acetylglucosamine deacetylase